MIRNVTKQKIIAEKAFYAVKFFHRLRGMVGRHFDRNLDAMVFDSCNAVHTFFMRMPIDVIFLDNENHIVKIRYAEPWRMCFRSSKACCVVELPAGACEKSSCSVGDLIELDAAGTSRNNE